MIAVDTNILVRYLVQDDPAQGKIAARFLEDKLTADAPGFVSTVAVLELNWVLRAQFELSPQVVSDTLLALMKTPNLVFEQRAALEKALVSDHGDIADNILHETAQAQGCTKTVTMDKKFARKQGVELLL